MSVCMCAEWRWKSLWIFEWRNHKTGGKSVSIEIVGLGASEDGDLCQLSMLCDMRYWEDFWIPPWWDKDQLNWRHNEEMYHVRESQGLSYLRRITSHASSVWHPDQAFLCSEKNFYPTNRLWTLPRRCPDLLHRRVFRFTYCEEQIAAG